MDADTDSVKNFMVRIVWAKRMGGKRTQPLKGSTKIVRCSCQPEVRLVSAGVN